MELPKTEAEVEAEAAGQAKATDFDLGPQHTVAVATYQSSEPGQGLNSAATYCWGAVEAVEQQEASGANSAIG